ncbi:MAG: hypothetical protein MAG453_01442 [Calditrichaeota bacterium]|nr:hypothetical protein [Calditrichota bacterium]
MKYATFAAMIVSLLFATTAGIAQTPPPVNATAVADENGEVNLTWLAPFSADYIDDFEDGEAQDWQFDSPGT